MQTTTMQKTKINTPYHPVCVTYIYVYNHIEAFVLVMALCSILLFTFDDTIQIHQMAYTNLGHWVGFITTTKKYTEIAFYCKNTSGASVDVRKMVKIH